MERLSGTRNASCSKQAGVSNLLSRVNESYQQTPEPLRPRVPLLDSDEGISMGGRNSKGGYALVHNVHQTRTVGSPKSASRHAHVCINQLPLTYLLVWMYKMRCCIDNQVGGRFMDLKAGYISRTG
ncbi:hypothetical protein TWF102_009729 [Orbilia oligospora]|uniref:Uncharacterized protein n=1 Tax=Orbilia oligospora TaxID=2813651 RepID=A0A7C8J4X6_ORBOL|nr:hypothetical protein TWF102_009729 [Orbilia oligospora]